MNATAPASCDVRPPLPTWAPLAWWSATATVLVVVVVFFVGQVGPLDDPNQGQQRPALLTPSDEAPVVDDLGLPGNPVGRGPVLVAFDRDVPDAQQLSALRREIPDNIPIVLVTDNGSTPEVRQRRGLELLADPEGIVARKVAMPRPKDGGFPIGYALIDRAARVRYATLDPSYTEHAAEIATVAGALE